MARVIAKATMSTDLVWVGEIPDDIPKDEYWRWVRENVDGCEYTEDGWGEWTLYDVMEAEDE